MEPIKLLIVDSEEVFREGMAKLLKDQTKIDIIYHGSSGKSAVKKCSQTKPDMVMIDSNLTDGDALETVREIKECSPDAKIVVLSRSDSENNPLDFMKAGARAVLAKNISVNDLIKSLDLISTGRVIVSPLFAEKFLEELTIKNSGEEIKSAQNESLLSERELEIARLIAQGATNREIAGKLFITENTAKVHVKNILNKLELKNRQQVAVYAVMQEWVVRNPDIENKDIANPV